MGNNLTKTPNFGSIKCFVSLNVGKYLVINQQRHFINTNHDATGLEDLDPKMGRYKGKTTRGNNSMGEPKWGNDIK